MLVLAKWTSIASVKALRSTSQQRARFKTVRKKTVPASGLIVEERRLAPGLGRLQYCSIWMAHKTTSSGWRVPGVGFCWQERIVRHGVDTMTSKLSFQTGASDSLLFHLQKKQRLIPRVQARNCTFSTLLRRSTRCQKHSKWSVAQLRHLLWLPGNAICSVRGPDERKLPFALSCVFYFVSHIS